jgi:hypothetical protein
VLNPFLVFVPFSLDTGKRTTNKNATGKNQTNIICRADSDFAHVHHPIPAVTFAAAVSCTVPKQQVYLIHYSSDPLSTASNNDTKDLHATLLEVESKQSRGPRSRWYNPEYTISNSRSLLFPTTTTASQEGRHCDLHSVRIGTATTPTITNAAARSVGATGTDGEGQSDTVDGVQDWIFLEDADTVMVAIVVQQSEASATPKEKIWMVEEQRGYAIPGSTYLTPVHGALQSNSEVPFGGAVRVVSDFIVIDDRNTPLLSVKVPQAIVLDRHGVAEGTVPELYNSNNKSNPSVTSSWTYLGRYRNLADSGGGFTYSYLLQVSSLLDDVVTATAKRPKFLSTDQVRQALLQGEFQETKGAATMALALLQMHGE